MLALGAAGCSLRAGGDDAGGKATTVVRTEPSVEPSGPVKVQKTRVHVVSGIGTRGGFDAPEIYRRLSPGVVTVAAQIGGPGKGGLGSGFVLDGRGYVAAHAPVGRGGPPQLERPTNGLVGFPGRHPRPGQGGGVRPHA